MTFNKARLLRTLFTYFGRCPTPTRLRWGRLLGWLAPRLLKSRAHIVRTNLRLCFPELDEAAREALLKRHFRLLAQSIIDRGLIWFGDPERVRQTVQLKGYEHLEQAMAAGEKILILAPHFVGLDAAGSRVAMDSPTFASFYTPSSDADIDALMREGRQRFNQTSLVSRDDGVRDLIRLLRKGIPVYYLPDMDFGREGAVFVPFFGIQAATLLSTAQIARSWQATVLPIVSRLDETTGQYHVELMPPIPGFPGSDGPEADTARINHLLEDWIRRDPAQYYWVHRRFKTRPPGESRPY